LPFGGRFRYYRWGLFGGWYGTEAAWFSSWRKKEVRTMSNDKPQITKIEAIGIIISSIAALLAAFIAWNQNQIADQQNQKQNQIQIELQQIQESQFSRELEQKYVEIFYQEIVSGNSIRQNNALTLLLMIQPATGEKLNQWAKQSGLLTVKAKEESKKIETQLNSRIINSRFRLFIHLGQVNSRPVLERNLLIQKLESQGFQVVGFDNKSDKYGPGVDFFDEKDRKGAEKVVEIINTLLPPEATKLIVRRQNVMQREGVLGIWF